MVLSTTCAGEAAADSAVVEVAVEGHAGLATQNARGSEAAVSYLAEEARLVSVKRMAARGSAALAGLR